MQEQESWKKNLDSSDLVYLAEDEKDLSVKYIVNLKHEKLYFLDEAHGGVLIVFIIALVLLFLIGILVGSNID